MNYYKYNCFDLNTYLKFISCVQLWRIRVTFFLYMNCYNETYLILGFVNPELQCPRCLKIFIGKYTRNRHMKYDCGQIKLFQCPYCKHGVKQKYNLLMHVKAKHVEKTEEFINLFYQTAFTRRSNQISVKAIHSQLS